MIAFTPRVKRDVRDVFVTGVKKTAGNTFIQQVSGEKDAVIACRS